MHNVSLFFFFFNDTATTEIYTLSLHDALPISGNFVSCLLPVPPLSWILRWSRVRSEEHTSELQSRLHLVCRLLLEKKKKQEMEADFVYDEGAYISLQRIKNSVAQVSVYFSTVD